MTQQVEFVEEVVVEEGQSLLESVRRVLMAGVGAVTLAQEEVEEFVSKLIDRGELADKDGRKLVSDFVERRRETVREKAKWVEGEFDQRVEGLLNRLNIPSKSDIDRLTKKIDALNRKINKLKKEMA